MWNTVALNKHAFEYCKSLEAFFFTGLRNVVPSRQTRRFIEEFSCHRLLTVHSPGSRKFQNTARNFRWPRKQPRSLDPTLSCFNNFWLSFAGGFEDKVYKTNSHTPQELRNNIRRENSTISGQELLYVNDKFRKYEWIRSGGQYFEHLLYHCEIYYNLLCCYHCSAWWSSLH